MCDKEKRAKEQKSKSPSEHQQLRHGCRTFLDACTSPTAQLPRIFGLSLRHEDLVQKQCLIHWLGGKFLGMFMPESTSNFRIALLNDSVANHGHLLFGLTFNGPWVVDDDCSHTNLLSIFDSAQCSEKNVGMEVRDVSPRSFCQLGGQHCDAQRAFEAQMVMQSGRRKSCRRSLHCATLDCDQVADPAELQELVTNLTPCLDVENFCRTASGCQMSLYLVHNVWRRRGGALARLALFAFRLSMSLIGLFGRQFLPSQNHQSPSHSSVFISTIFRWLQTSGRHPCNTAATHVVRHDRDKTLCKPEPSLRHVTDFECIIVTKVKRFEQCRHAVCLSYLTCNVRLWKERKHTEIPARTKMLRWQPKCRIRCNNTCKLLEDYNRGSWQIQQYNIVGLLWSWVLTVVTSMACFFCCLSGALAWRKTSMWRSITDLQNFHVLWVERMKSQWTSEWEWVRVSEWISKWVSQWGRVS